MNSTQAEEEWDLLFLVDATSSMSHYLSALRQSLPQILSISGLTNCFERVGLVAYRDYCDRNLLEWSGWRGHKIPGKPQPDLVTIASKLVATGGGDYPEAMKTGLAKCYQVMREDAKTLILLYTDAPPHMHNQADSGYAHRHRELENLRDLKKYDGQGEKFIDWVSAAKTLVQGSKKAQVMAILDGHCAGMGIYEYLTTMTGGVSLYLKNSSPRHISELSVEILLAWMGVHKAGSASATLHVDLLRYVEPGGIEDIQSEQDPNARVFFDVQTRSDLAGIERLQLTADSLRQLVPTKSTPLQDFTKTYKQSEKYRMVVAKHLRDILERDVTAMTLNPVFGSLWRVFCTDRLHPERQELLDLFGRKVDAIRDRTQQQAMKLWLEESYDYTAEVTGLVEAVEHSRRFPCVCLDPSLAFEHARENDGDETSQTITAFRRDELLEIGRSCDYRVLRRLSRILTRLTFIHSASEMPAHIAATTNEQVPKIPLALASAEYGHEFWRVLLHIVVPGTMLSARPAAVLAALSIRTGVQPLHDAAVLEMMRWKTRWNDIDTHETWNSSCLTLLLDADKSYKESCDSLDTACGLLLPQDRKLFQTLVEYKLLEANLRTDLTARVGWTPEKTMVPIGHLVRCRRCKLLRSVTIMAPDNVCGLCTLPYKDEKEDQKCKSANVTDRDDESTNAYWYECAVQHCRAQYVVYNVDMLYVRPKCHYCRAGKTAAPVVECGICLSRMIWPEEYRPKEHQSGWICVACRGSRATIVNVDTTAETLRRENGDAWLLRNEQKKLSAPFNGRTLYHVASTAVPLKNFADRVRVLPARDTDEDIELYIKGKLVRDPRQLLNELYSWVSRRQAEQGTCTLCFSDFKKTNLVNACGRSGCHQKVCQACATAWYGINNRGRVLNLAAVCCPFCRRRPNQKTLMKYGLGINTLADLDAAWREQGQWIFAWCRQCDHARRYVERVCANGAPPQLTRWTCDECTRGPVDGVRLCPGCKIPTEKMGGCDHMTCTACHAHWCWVCGLRTRADEIYDHLTTHMEGDRW